MKTIFWTLSKTPGEWSVHWSDFVSFDDVLISSMEHNQCAVHPTLYCCEQLNLWHIQTELLISRRFFTWHSRSRAFGARSVWVCFWHSWNCWGSQRFCCLEKMCTGTSLWTSVFQSACIISTLNNHYKWKPEHYFASNIKVASCHFVSYSNQEDSAEQLWTGSTSCTVFLMVKDRPPSGTYCMILCM